MSDTKWGQFRNPETGVLHVIPKTEDGKMHPDHIVSMKCKCIPECIDSVWLHNEEIEDV